MKLTPTIKYGEIDRGFEQLKKNLLALEKGRSYVKIGVFGGKGSKRDTASLDNVRLAIIHEFGVPEKHIPERSFIRTAFDKNRLAYITILKKLLPGVYEGKREMGQVLGILGVKAVADVQAFVRAGTNLTPLAESTFKRKLSKSYRGKRQYEGPLQAPKPLIDTGRLLQSVTYELVLFGTERPGGS